MSTLYIANRRLRNQHITGARVTAPGELVQWLGAVQAQDYAAAKWALGLRLPGSTDAEIEQACDDGTILRTHLMRPTWHFVSPADIRWLLTLTAPRVNAACAYWYRKLELDETIFNRSRDELVKALQGGNYLTRPELGVVLRKAGIITDDLRISYLMIRAELEGIVCNGPKKGKQFTYALLEERVPKTPTLDHDEALAKLALRYFTSRGPATLQDFSWWSGLSVAEARIGRELVKAELVNEVIDGQTYWSGNSSPIPEKDEAALIYLLPNFDEYIVAYKDRSAMFDPAYSQNLGPRENVLFNYIIVVNGHVCGLWKRKLKKNTIVITTNLFMPLDPSQIETIADAANLYGKFLDSPIKLI